MTLQYKAVPWYCMNTGQTVYKVHVPVCTVTNNMIHTAQKNMGVPQKMNVLNVL